MHFFSCIGAGDVSLNLLSELSISVFLLPLNFISCLSVL